MIFVNAQHLNVRGLGSDKLHDIYFREVSGILMSIINSQKDDVKMIGNPNIDNNKK